MTESKTSTPLWLYIILCLVSVLFVLIHSSSTSPLYIGYGFDSANYLTMGKMLLDGRIPYLDFFDHKGPMMIFIEAFGQMIIPDRLGICILQIVSLTLTTFMIYKSANLYINKLYSFSVVCISLIFLGFTLENGNLTEEYSLLFLSISFYLTCLFIKSENNKVKPFHILIIGVCAGFLLWIRLNNLSVLCACCTFILFVTIKNKDWIGFRNLIVYFTLGLLIVSIPVCLYFYLHNALYDMFFASFIYNFKYVGENVSEDVTRSIATFGLYIFKAWIPFIILFLGTIIYYLKKRNYKIILFSVLLFFFGYVATHIGAAYYHYMILNIPCLVLGCIYLYAIFEKSGNKETILKITSIFFIVLLILFSGYRMRKFDAFGEGDSYYITKVRELVDKIPENERNSILAYQCYNRFYPSANVLPCYRYFMMQEWQGSYNEQILISINEMMKSSDSPKWLFTQFRDQSTNSEFWKTINERYELFEKNELLELYRLKKMPEPN